MRDPDVTPPALPPSDRGGRPRGLLLAWAAALALLSTASVQIARTYGDRRSGNDQFQCCSADFLAAAALYDDAFVDGYPLTGFQFSAATFAVPDMLLYVPVRAAAGSAGAAQIPWQVAVFGALVLSAWYALAGFAPPGARPWVGPLVLTVTAAFVASVAAQFLANEARDLLLPGCHTGAQSLAFLSAGLTARYARDGRRWRLVGLALVAAAAAFSDRLFALYYPVPAFLALGLARLVAPSAGPRLTWWRVLVPAVAVAIGCGVGLAALKRVPNPGADSDPIGGYWAGVETDGLAHRTEQLGLGAERQMERHDALVISSAAWLVTSAGVLVLLAARRLLRAGSPRLPVGLGDYLAYTLVAFAVVTAVFLVSTSGAKCLEPVCTPWGFFDRYFAGPQSLALFGWALLLASAAARGGVTRLVALLAPALLAGYLLALSFQEPRAADRDLLDPYPKFVRALDEVCARRGLSRGFSAYWHAKEVTSFSKTGARAHAVSYQPAGPNRFTPYVWLSNAHWLFPRPGEAPYQFILASRVVLPGTGDIPADAVAALFGPPAEQVEVENVVIMVYDRPQDERFRVLLAGNPELGKLQYKLDPRAKIRFPGCSFFGGTTRPGDGTARVARPGDKPGCVAFGPYLTPRMAGWHYAEFRLKGVGSDGSAEMPGSVDVYYHEDDPEAERFLTYAHGVPAGYDGTMRLEFEVTPEMVGRGTLQFHAHYQGRGTLTLEYVDFGRFRK